MLGYRRRAFHCAEVMAIPYGTMAEWLDDSAGALPLLAGGASCATSRTLSRQRRTLLALVPEPLGALEKIYSVLKNVDLAARLPEVP